MNKLARSNAAHGRLHKKHQRKQVSNPAQYDKHFILSSYHFNVLNQQKKKGRMLSPEEKRKAYNNVISTFY